MRPYLYKELKKMCVKLVNYNNMYYVYNALLSDLFGELFDYGHIWNPLIQNKLDLIWNGAMT